MRVSYYIAKQVAGPFDAVVIDLLARLQSAGFSVIADIDIQATFRSKLGLESPAYRIFGACNARLAQEALGIEDKLGALLPCNVIVHEVPDDRVEVASVDPVVALDRTGNPALARIAFEVRRQLTSVVEGIRG